MVTSRAEPNRNGNSVFLLEDNYLDTRKELSINAFFSLRVKTERETDNLPAPRLTSSVHPTSLLRIII